MPTDQERTMQESDPRSPREERVELPSGGRPYPAAEPPERPQGPRSSGQSEPGDMGAFDDKTYAAPRPESPAGDGGRGYRGA
jgi:hypothetical protein